jgi:hypothetical protein
MPTSNEYCPICKGEQWLYEYEEENLVAKRCVCLVRKLLHAFLGPELCKAKWIKSELYQGEQDKTGNNLFIRGTWEVICRHLYWVLSAKYLYSPGFTYKIVDDIRLLRIWLGDEKYTNKPREIRDHVECYNNLLDLLPYPSLVIIRLGFVERNKAMADVFHEALKTRKFMPTWIVEGNEQFVYGHSAYNNEVHDYIRENFETINLGGDVEAVRKTKKEDTEEALNFGVGFGPGTEAPKAHEFQTELCDDVPKNKKSFKKTFKKKTKNDGGLPEID